MFSRYWWKNVSMHCRISILLSNRNYNLFLSQQFFILVSRSIYLQVSVTLYDKVEGRCFFFKTMVWITNGLLGSSQLQRNYVTEHTDTSHKIEGQLTAPYQRESWVYIKCIDAEVVVKYTISIHNKPYLVVKVINCEIVVSRRKAANMG